MRVVVGGATGYVGTALVPALRAEGHEVLRLVRHAAREPDEVAWDPSRGVVDRERLRGVEGGILLNGANVGTRRWTASYKDTLLRSRVDTTRTLSEAFAALEPRPRVLIPMSASGYYGDTGPEPVDESAPPGDTFLAHTVVSWEAAADPAREAGIRVVHPRMAMVFGPGGSSAGRLSTVVKFGLGGRLGGGRQKWALIATGDVVRVFSFLLERDDLAGPVNVATSPVPTNAEVIRELGRALHRPTPWIAPTPVLRLVLGEFAHELTLNQAISSARLTGAGFTLRYPDLKSVIRHAVSPTPAPQ
ncbi:MAG: TIGR01777 family oxidoreductase [Actinomycetes bacterium]